jgi:serine/threonine protein kinase
MMEVNSLLDGKYKILSLLGSGGMGSVFLAHHIGLDRQVALKVVMLPVDDDVRRLKSRFEREAAILCALQQRNIVGFYGYGIDGNCQYIAMEYIVGESLRQRLSCGALPIDLTISIMEQVCSGLLYAHKHDVVHRDLKPENIMLVCDENDAGPLTVKLIDFGLACFDNKETNQKLTEAGFMVGTVEYASPEQCKGETVDHRSDIYSVGCVLHHCLSGEPPFQAPHSLVVMQQHVVGTPTLLQDDAMANDLPADMLHILRRSLAKSADERYQHLDELLQDLQEIKQKLDATGVMPKGKSVARKSIPGHSSAKSKLNKAVLLGLSACVVLGMASLYVWSSGLLGPRNSSQELQVPSPIYRNAQYELAEGRRFLRANEFDRSVRHFRAALEMATNSKNGLVTRAEALEGLGDVYKEMDRPKVAKGFYLQALGLVPDKPFNPDYVSVLLLIANEARECGDVNAVDFYKRAIEYCGRDNPRQCRDCYLDLGSCYLISDPKTALKYYVQARKITEEETLPVNSWGTMGMGISCMHLNKTAEAVHFLKQARLEFLERSAVNGNGLAQTDMELVGYYLLHLPDHKVEARELVQEVLNIDEDKTPLRVKINIREFKAAAREALKKLE